MMRDNDLGSSASACSGPTISGSATRSCSCKEVAGSDQNFRLDEFAETMRSRIVSIFADALASAHVPVFDVASRYSELGDALLPIINPVVQAKYGLEIASFIVENVSVPPEVEQAIDKRSSMAAVGNLNDYVKFQMAQGMEKGGGSGRGGDRARRRPVDRAADHAAAGDAVGDRIHRGRGRVTLPDLLGPADVASCWACRKPT